MIAKEIYTCILAAFTGLWLSTASAMPTCHSDPAFSDFSTMLPIIKNKFPGWKLVEPMDLRKDDQSYWVKHYKNKCPSFALGNFKNKFTKSYAVTLYKSARIKSVDTLRQILFVITPVDGVKKIVILSKPQVVAYLSVVYKIDAGTYMNSTGQTVHSDGISYEALESGAIVYYFDNKKYISIQASE